MSLSKLTARDVRALLLRFTNLAQWKASDMRKLPTGHRALVLTHFGYATLAAMANRACMELAAQPVSDSDAQAHAEMLRAWRTILARIDWDKLER